MPDSRSILRGGERPAPRAGLAMAPVRATHDAPPACAAHDALAAPSPARAAGPAAPGTVVETETEVREHLAPLSAVVCHDDPVTTMEFVVEVLRSVFRLPYPRAMDVMLRVHHTGAAVVGRYPRELAERKVQRATTLARAERFPLTFSVEEDG